MKARVKAYHCLCDICLGNKYSNLVLRKELNDFSDADKRFITSLVYGTMQNFLYLRYQWESYVETSIAKDMALLMDMSIYQLLFMDKVPTYAVVNEAVEIAGEMHRGKYRTMINAMLRRYLREGKKEIIADPAKTLSLETSHPLWLVKMWEKQYGWEITEKICHDNQRVAPLAARVNTNVSSVEEIIANNPLFSRGQLSPDAVIYEQGNIANTKEFLTGKITIQDEASQCVALFLDPQPGESILDACAAPGTKTTHIAQIMKNQGEVIATDIHEHRVELIRHGAARLGFSCIKPTCLDATQVYEQFGENRFDRILVDVPCSGYGVMKRKNDIKVHMDSSDMDRIIPVQKQILEATSQCLKDGGILVYSTCTLNKKENDKQIEAFLKEHPEFTCLESRTIFPFDYNCDGFFMAKLQKGTR